MTTELFDQEFQNCASQLKSYILRITTALDKLATFRSESSLKTWIFTIASNLAKDNLRVQKRWVENVTDITKAAALSNRPFFE